MFPKTKQMKIVWNILSLSFRALPIIIARMKLVIMNAEFVIIRGACSWNENEVFASTLKIIAGSPILSANSLRTFVQSSPIFPNFTMSALARIMRNSGEIAVRIWSIGGGYVWILVF